LCIANSANRKVWCSLNVVVFGCFVNMVFIHKKLTRAPVHKAPSKLVSVVMYLFCALYLLSASSPQRFCRICKNSGVWNNNGHEESKGHQKKLVEFLEQKRIRESPSWGLRFFAEWARQECSRCATLGLPSLICIVVLQLLTLFGCSLTDLICRCLACYVDIQIHDKHTHK
jgi:hypothetical protein